MVQYDSKWCHKELIFRDGYKQKLINVDIEDVSICIGLYMYMHVVSKILEYYINQVIIDIIDPLMACDKRLWLPTILLSNAPFKDVGFELFQPLGESIKYAHTTVFSLHPQHYQDHREYKSIWKTVIL